MAPHSRVVQKKPLLNKLAPKTTSKKKPDCAKDKHGQTDGFDSDRFVNWIPKSARTISNRGTTSSSTPTPRARTIPQRLDAMEKQLKFLFGYMHTGFQRNETLQTAVLQSRGVQLPPLPPFPTEEDCEIGHTDINDDTESGPEHDD